MGCLAGWGPWSLLGSCVTGHKLRLNITGTALIQGRLLKAWLYTDTKTGVVQNTPSSSLSCGALLHKLQSQHENPNGWVALAHFSNYVTRLITAQELEELLTGIYVGAVPESVGAARAQAADEASPELVALQGYITPVDDARYITTFGGIEGATIFTQARKYSDRFAAAPSRAAAAQTAASVVQQALTVAAAGAASCVSLQQQVKTDDPNHIVGNGSVLEGDLNSGLASSETGYRHSDVMLNAAAATSQEGCATPTMPVAAAHWRNSVCSDGEASASDRSGDADKTGHGTKPPFPGLQLAASSTATEPTRTSDSDADGPVTFRVQSAPQAVSKAAAAAVQVLLSHLDKAYGLRVAGLAAEFVLDKRQQLWLIGLNSITLDPQQSKGSTATFTERWTEFVAGVGPPPAPHLAQHTDFAATAAAGSPKGGLGIADRTAGAARGRAVSPKPGGGVLSSMQQLKIPSAPLLSVDLADLPCPRPQSADPSNKASPGALRPTSAPRSMRSPSSQPARPSTASPSRQRMSSVAGSTELGSPSSIRGGAPKYTSKNAASAARPGAGGNPTARPSTSDSYNLWLQHPVRPGDSITAQLAGQLEYAKEQVQQYADMAEAAMLQSQEATQQAARQVSSVQQELLQLRHDAAAASRERRHLQEQVVELEHQRSSTQQGMAQLHQQFTALQDELTQDRATMAAVLRQHQQQKQQYEEQITSLQQQNAELRHSCQQATNRLDEESEVVSALRAQLVDYKLQVEQMNLQAKKGRSLYTNNSSMVMRRGGAATPPMQQVGYSTAGALSSGGLGAGMSGDLTSMTRGSSSRGISSGGIAASSISFGPSIPGTVSKQEQYLRYNKGLGSSPGSRQATEEHLLASTGAAQSAAAGVEAAGLGDSGGRAVEGVDRLAAAAAANTTGSPFARAAGTHFGGSNPPSGVHAAEHLQQQQVFLVDPQQPQQSMPCDISDPDAAISSITAALSADTGEQLVAGARVKPQLFIADLLCDSLGDMEKTAEQQLAVLSGLMQEIHGDLLEMYGYYATLGGVVVLADRMTMDLPQFGKLAYDLHIAQNNRSLSAVEDAFYVLSDRRPCLALQNRVRPPSADATHRSNRLKGRIGSSPDCTITGAAAAAAAESGTAYLGPGTQHAVAHAAAWDNISGGLSGRLDEGMNSAAATAAAVMATVLGPDVIVPEQFAEALIRLACVRYRWGAVRTEYDWDNSDDDHDNKGFEQALQGHLAALPPGSARMQRLKQLRQQQEKNRRGPRVLRPEGKDLYTGSPPSVAMKATATSTRSVNVTTPSKCKDADCPMPSAEDNLLTVAKTFLQSEVLQHARRNRLAGSPLGQRKARSKSPSRPGAWRTTPR